MERGMREAAGRAAEEAAVGDTTWLGHGRMPRGKCASGVARGHSRYVRTLRKEMQTRMPFYIARCQWRDDGSLAEPGALPDAWSLLDEEFYSREEVEAAAAEDRLQQMQQRGGWMGIHRLGLQRLDYRFFEAEDFEGALEQARRRLTPDGELVQWRVGE